MKITVNSRQVEISAASITLLDLLCILELPQHGGEIYHNKKRVRSEAIRTVLVSESDEVLVLASPYSTSVQV